MKLRLTALCAIAIALLVSCGPSAPAATPEELAGFWKRENEFGEMYYIQFFADGTYSATHSLDWFEIDDLIDQVGTYVIDGNEITFATDADRTVCGGQSGTYELLINADGWMEMTLVEDECTQRNVRWVSEPWEPVSP